MSVLWITRVTVTDPEAYQGYIPLASEAIAAHGGVFLARGGEATQLEGEGRDRNVVIRFPSKEAALACYHSPTYQKALTFADRGAVRDLVLVEELPQTPSSL